MDTEADTGGGQPTSGRNYAALTRARERLDGVVAQGPGETHPEWLERVRGAVRSLFETLGQHRHVSEDEGGTLLEEMAEKPALATEITRLEGEHVDMLRRASEIEEEIERQLAFQEYKVELVRLETTVLRDILRLHLLRADWLVYDAYFRIEGGEGG